jgi:hypothetical protein
MWLPRGPIPVQARVGAHGVRAGRGRGAAVGAIVRAGAVLNVRDHGLRRTQGRVVDALGQRATAVCARLVRAVRGTVAGLAVDCTTAARRSRPAAPVAVPGITECFAADPQARAAAHLLVARAQGHAAIRAVLHRARAHHRSFFTVKKTPPQQTSACLQNRQARALCVCVCVWHISMECRPQVSSHFSTRCTRATPPPNRNHSARSHASGQNFCIGSATNRQRLPSRGQYSPRTYGVRVAERGTRLEDRAGAAVAGVALVDMLAAVVAVLREERRGGGGMVGMFCHTFISIAVISVYDSST